MTSPPLGATALSVIRPVEVLPPFTEAGITRKVRIVGGLIVRVADSVTPLRDPEIEAVV